MPDQEQGVRVAGAIRITCAVISADTLVTFAEIAWKLLLVEAMTDRSGTKGIEGVLAVTTDGTRRTATAKGTKKGRRTSCRSSSRRYSDDYR